MQSYEAPRTILIKRNDRNERIPNGQRPRPTKVTGFRPISPSGAAAENTSNLIKSPSKSTISPNPRKSVSIASLGKLDISGSKSKHDDEEEDDDDDEQNENNNTSITNPSPKPRQTVTSIQLNNSNNNSKN